MCLSGALLMVSLSSKEEASQPPLDGLPVEASVAVQDCSHSNGIVKLDIGFYKGTLISSFY